MPTIIQQSISILSDAGLGMAMFSLGKSSSSYPITFLSFGYRIIANSTESLADSQNGLVFFFFKEFFYLMWPVMGMDHPTCRVDDARSYYISCRGGRT